jgi:hypothetical protein
MVKMATLALTCFAFAAGLTLCGLAGSTMELFVGQRLSFRAPFVTSRHVLRSLLVAAAAGPLMLTNDALEAWRSGEVSMLLLLSCALSAAGWALATGIVTVDLAVRATDLLS